MDIISTLVAQTTIIVVNKIDSATAREWEEYKVDNSTPKSEDLKRFLKGKADIGVASTSNSGDLVNSSEETDRRHEESNKLGHLVSVESFYSGKCTTRYGSGCDTEEQAIENCHQISNILGKGCFELRKWRSNDQDVINYLQADRNNDPVYFGKDEKTLGLVWPSASDHMMYEIKVTPNIQEFTKRSVLSDIARIFDPLGLLSPCVLYAKTLLQRLWLIKLSWDDPLPREVEAVWGQFRTELPILNALKIPRKVVCDNANQIEFHCFVDASQGAYTEDAFTLDRKINIQGVSLKSGTVVNVGRENLYHWAISLVSYILKHGPLDRVAEIQNITSSYSWKHILTKQNPADLLTRGVMPSKMIFGGTVPVS
ncbi:hypothetical protein NQ317_018818 [Molorchus minor]|uniref:Uncharacterized protein n=1 Tax=Molorchus minor TaxID=1323400 RepID=A0ABQ9JRE3_9CUCU|nr:hypothetical protein NQ317_018818 [Molorchus minor]